MEAPKLCSSRGFMKRLVFGGSLSLKFTLLGRGGSQLSRLHMDMGVDQCPL